VGFACYHKSEDQEIKKKIIFMIPTTLAIGDAEIGVTQILEIFQFYFSTSS